MFEDSTFETTGSIHTRSGAWIFGTTLFDAAILLALVLIPLINPEALPRQALAILLTAPPPPVAEFKPQPAAERPSAPQAERLDDPFRAPSLIPHNNPQAVSPEPPQTGEPLVAALETTPGGSPNRAEIFRPQPAPHVQPATQPPMRVSSSVVEGLLLNRVRPDYPPIARISGVQGTVALAATISKFGTIENLRVVSGPVMLQKAALDAVSDWRYRPYLLNGQPIEVETTVSVVFTLAR